MGESNDLEYSEKMPSSYGVMRGTVTELGDIITPIEHAPSHAELGIAYIGENGPVYYTGNGTETTDDV